MVRHLNTQDLGCLGSGFPGNDVAAVAAALPTLYSPRDGYRKEGGGQQNHDGDSRGTEGPGCRDAQQSSQHISQRIRKADDREAFGNAVLLFTLKEQGAGEGRCATISGHWVPPDGVEMAPLTSDRSLLSVGKFKMLVPNRYFGRRRANVKHFPPAQASALRVRRCLEPEDVWGWHQRVQEVLLPVEPQLGFISGCRAGQWLP